MTSLPPRPPPADTASASRVGGTSSFSVKDLRASLESRARTLETTASAAAAAVRTRFTTEVGGLFLDEEDVTHTANAFVELARRPAERVSQAVARLTPEDNMLMRGVKTSVRSAAVGMRRVRTVENEFVRSGTPGGDTGTGDGNDTSDVFGADGDLLSDNSSATGGVFPGSMFTLPPRLAAAPTLLREQIDKTVALRPEWDVFKSLKSGSSENGSPGRSFQMKPPGTHPQYVPGQYVPGSTSSAGLDDLLRNIEARIEATVGGFGKGGPNGGTTPFAKDFTPSELLTKVHDAGNAAVREWLATAREKAEMSRPGALTSRKRNPAVRKQSRSLASMSEGEFREAEAAAALTASRSADARDASLGTNDPSKYSPEEDAFSDESLSSLVSPSASGSLTSPEKSMNAPGTSPTTTLTSVANSDEESLRLEARRDSLAAGTSAVSTTGRDVVGSPPNERDMAGLLPTSKQRVTTPIRTPGRSVAIVTTASLPWMTGTAVNPLLRAAYLAKRGTHDVTLVVPWLPPEEQVLIHPGIVFETTQEQDKYVRQWVKDRCGFECTNLKLDFYPGRYAKDKYSIIPVGDVSKYISSKNKHVAVLEEPEHLNWYHSGDRWSDQFEHVVGVVHTNYLEYARLEKHGQVKEVAMRFVNAWVSRTHCHKIIKLSDAVQDFPRSETVNVHGVSPVFLEVGRRKATAALQATAAEGDPDAAASLAVGRTVSKALASLSARSERQRSASEGRKSNDKQSGKNDSSKTSQKKPTCKKEDQTPEQIHPSSEVFDKGCYFLGKVVWGKGFHELLTRVEEHNASPAGVTHTLELDVFGSGEDFDAVSKTSVQKNLPLRFKGRADHASDQMHDYKVFINPSLSDVVATTSAEALAMGKFVICAKHPSNDFFGTFPNCLTYATPDEFSRCVTKALSTDPAPLTSKDRYRLSWEAATDRFLDAAELGAEQHTGPGSKPRDRIAEAAAHALHSSMARTEPLRRAAGAGEGTLHGPVVVDGKWVPP